MAQDVNSEWNPWHLGIMPVFEGGTDDPDPDPDPNAGGDPDPDPDPNGGGGTGDPDPGAGDDPADSGRRKEESKLAYQLRMAQKDLTAFKKELEGYKRRDEEARKATLTKEQQLTEERDAAVRELNEARLEALRQKVGAEFKLPPGLVARLQGTDEDGMRADAEELARLIPKPKIGKPLDPAKPDGGAQPTFSRSQLRDPKFFKANEAAIMEAQRAGRITND